MTKSLWTGLRWATSPYQHGDVRLSSDRYVDRSQLVSERNINEFTDKEVDEILEQFLPLVQNQTNGDCISSELFII